jgi:hypothetical protein
MEHKCAGEPEDRESSSILRYVPIIILCLALVILVCLPLLPLLAIAILPRFLGEWVGHLLDLLGWFFWAVAWFACPIWLFLHSDWGQLIQLLLHWLRFGLL